MSSELPDFWKYITTNERGTMNGIRDDAPENMKESYRIYMEEEKERIKKGIKI